MVKGLYTAYTGMRNEEKRLEVTANNLANAATNGYKKEGATAQSFEDRLAYRIKDATTPGNVHSLNSARVTVNQNGQITNVVRNTGALTFGVKLGETYTNYEQGSFQVTDKKSDLAISGNGYFAISFTNKAGQTSIKYTRDGAFTVDTDGYLRTMDGDYVLNMNGARNSQNNQANYVRVDPNAEYSINSQGFITQNGQVVGQVGYVDFANYDFLAKYGENMYDLVPGGQIIAATGQIEQGMLESSNVNVVDEMVSMIAIQRAYETGQKMIQTEDSTLDKAVNQVGKV